MFQVSYTKTFYKNSRNIQYGSMVKTKVHKFIKSFMCRILFYNVLDVCDFRLCVPLDDDLVNTTNHSKSKCVHKINQRQEMYTNEAMSVRNYDQVRHVHIIRQSQIFSQEEIITKCHKNACGIFLKIVTKFIPFINQTVDLHVLANVSFFTAKDCKLQLSEMTKVRIFSLTKRNRVQDSINCFRKFTNFALS